MLEQMILGDHTDKKNSLKRTSPNALSAVQKRGRREPEQYSPDATKGCMENAQNFREKYYFSYRLDDKDDQMTILFLHKLCKFRIICMKTSSF
jgi:hypothetical protein